VIGAVRPSFFGQGLAQNREGLFKEDQILLVGPGVVSIEAELRDPLSLLSDASFPFTEMPSRDLQ